MSSLPNTCLSIRQPWAHMIVHGPKRYENRTWGASYPAIHFRGPFLIHASAGMTMDEYQDAIAFARECGFMAVPSFKECKANAGGIVGAAVVDQVVRDSSSPWFVGPIALRLTDVRPLPFTPCKGALGFFKLPAGVEIKSS
jgi:hypothetical protein